MSAPYSLKQAAVEATPASSVLVATATGASLDDWMKVAAFVFLVLQILYMLWRWRRDVRRDAREREDE